MNFWQLLLSLGIPSAIMSLLTAIILKKVDKSTKQSEQLESQRRADAEKRDKRNEEFLLLMLQSTRAAVVLSQATARAVQRIPDAHCNGDMHKALEYADKVQAKEKDFLMQLGIHALQHPND